MRILASNPDTIGDMVLRQPLYRALAEAGHELLLIVRPSVAPLVPFVAPGARTLVLPREVYSDDLDEYWAEFGGLVSEARKFRPDVLLVAPYRWTRFEERLAEAVQDVPGLRRIGMSGALYAGDPYAGRAPESRLTFDVTVDVAEESPEAEKNAALAAAVLGATLGDAEPKLEASEPSLAAARETLDRLGLEPGGYWLACVTGTANVPIKAWHVAGWARVLSDWTQRHGRRFLFVGLPEERAVAEDVRRAMGELADRTAFWMEPGDTLPQLIAITSLSAGYVGHDTGPMHIAAATGKPVLAVFGGGTWPRFLPRATPSVSLTVGVSCAGCGWSCSFATSHCVKDVPAEEVIRAFEDLEAGRVTGREPRVLEPSHALQQRMIREAAMFAQRQVREAGELSRQLRIWGPERVDALQRERDMLAAQNRGLGVQLEHRLAEVTHVRGELARASHEATGLVGQLQERERDAVRQRDEAARLRNELEAAVREADAVRLAAQEAQAVAKSNEDQAATLAERVQQLEGLAGPLAERLRQLEEQLAIATAPPPPPEPPPPAPSPAPPSRPARTRPPRRPWRAVLTDVFTGTREYVPRRVAPPMPILAVAVPIRADDAPADVRATIESVLAQAYPHLDFVLADAACDAAAQSTIDACRGDVTRVVCDAEGGPFGAVAKAFASTEADVIAWLEPGDVFEPGALLRVGEYFRDHPRAVTVTFDDTFETNGWRLPTPPRPRLDVLSLLAEDAIPAASFFLRRHEYTLLGPIDPARGWAAGWELMIRYGRRYGFRRGTGHVTCRKSRGSAAHPPDRASDFAAATDSFTASLGAAGRLRCRAIHAANAIAFRLRGLFPANRLNFATATNGAPLPPGEPPAFVAGQPVSPLTNRLPDRLLFTARDTNTEDRALHYIYYESASGAALAYPPVGPAALDASYAARETHRARGVVPADEQSASPYAGYCGGWFLQRLLARLPSPYWWFHKPEFGDVTHERLLAILAGRVRRNDADVRLLNVGCYEGILLDRLKALTKWQMAGTETNPRAARTARSKGHSIWETSAQDAAMTIPIGESFDVIFVSGLAAHWPDPVLVLRRLRQLLVPGGLLVLNQPNLDSALLDVFGPTWAHWQLPYHRTLMGRRGLHRLASEAEFRVARTRTYTDPYSATLSAQINALGLGAIVPDDARFPDEISSRGVRLTGWVRLLWDWRGRGDYVYTVMQAK